MPTAFLPGAELARRYYTEIVGPLLDRHAPSARALRRADRVGNRKYWDSTRRDRPTTTGARAARSSSVPGTRTARPASPRCWPTGSRPPSSAGRPGSPATAASSVPVHWVKVAELGDWLTGQLGFDPRAGVVGLLDWLATPTQVLANLAGGAVFWDGLATEPGDPAGGLRAARAARDWYPTTSGATCSPASGRGSARRRPFLAGAPRPATTSGPRGDSPARQGPDAADHPDAAALSAIQQVARDGLRPAARSAAALHDSIAADEIRRLPMIGAVDRQPTASSALTPDFVTANAAIRVFTWLKCGVSTAAPADWRLGRRFAACHRAFPKESAAAGDARSARKPGDRLRRRAQPAAAVRRER